jgi:hypothetical protein
MRCYFYDMSSAHSNDKQFLIYQIKWIGIYIAIGFAISLVLPFPISLVGALGAFLFLNFIRTRRMLKRSGIDMKGWFKSLSTISSPSLDGYNPLKYYCMSCGKEHKEIACPNCGSKMKRVG